MIDWLLGGAVSPGGELTWEADPGVIWVSLAGGLFLLYLAFRGRRAAATRTLEMALWGAALVVLVIASAQPAWVEEQGRTEEGRLIVLVDGSGSMAVEESGTPRSAEVDKIVESFEGDAVEVFTFGRQMSAGLKGTYDDPVTDFKSVLTAVGDRYAGEKLAGVVMITDGIDRGPLRRGWEEGEEPEPPSLPGPLTVYQVGTPAALKDLSVKAVSTGGYGYIHASFPISAELQGVGFGNRTVNVELLRDGAVVRTQAVLLDADGSGEVTFEVVDDEPGRFTYEVKVPVFEGDAVPANNRAPVVVQVVRDRIRVLQVSGAPSWDVKFLRRFLKGDPSVDLVSFFILRTTADMRTNYSDFELSLIEFPTEQLFTEDLSTFDLVVFQNFDYEPYFRQRSDKLLGNIRDFVVEEGHAFVMIGGDRSFSLGKYDNTPLGPILPVSLSPTPNPASEEPFRASLTEDGRRHPVTRLVQSDEENVAWWDRLYPLDGTNQVFDARPEASVLLTHPTLKTPSGEPLPVLSVMEAGKGRTMAFTGDTSWRWSSSEAALGRGNQAYLRFWKGAIRWLIGDPSTRRLTVETARENYAIGDRVRVVVEAKTPGFEPMPDVPLQVVVSSDAREESFDVISDANGEAVVQLDVDQRGAYRITATPTPQVPGMVEAQTVFAVTSRDPELSEVIPDPTFSKWLAERAGGRFYPQGQQGKPLIDAESGRTSWDQTRVALWRAPLVPLLFGLFAGLGWMVRRRAGLR